MFICRIIRRRPRQRRRPPTNPPLPPPTKKTKKTAPPIPDAALLPGEPAYIRGIFTDQIAAHFGVYGYDKRHPIEKAVKAAAEGDIEKGMSLIKIPPGADADNDKDIVRKILDNTRRVFEARKNAESPPDGDGEGEGDGEAGDSSAAAETPPAPAATSDNAWLPKDLRGAQVNFGGTAIRFESSRDLVAYILHRRGGSDSSRHQEYLDAYENEYGDDWKERGRRLKNYVEDTLASAGGAWLPPGLGGAKPRYGAGVWGNFEVIFADDRALVAYILANPGESARHAHYRRFWENAYTPDDSSPENRQRRIKSDIRAALHKHKKTSGAPDPGEVGVFVVGAGEVQVVPLDELQELQDKNQQQRATQAKKTIEIPANWESLAADGESGAAAAEATPSAPAAKKGGVKYPPIAGAQLEKLEKLRAEEQKLLAESDALRQQAVSRRRRMRVKKREELHAASEKLSDEAHALRERSGMPDGAFSHNYAPSHVVWRAHGGKMDGHYQDRKVVVDILYVEKEFPDNKETTASGWAVMKPKPSARWRRRGWGLKLPHHQEGDLPPEEEFDDAVFNTAEAAMRAGAEWLVNGTIPQSEELSPPSGAWMIWEEVHEPIYDAAEDWEEVIPAPDGEAAAATTTEEETPAAAAALPAPKLDWGDWKKHIARGVSEIPATADFGGSQKFNLSFNFSAAKVNIGRRTAESDKPAFFPHLMENSTTVAAVERLRHSFGYDTPEAAIAAVNEIWNRGWGARRAMYMRAHQDAMLAVYGADTFRLADPYRALRKVDEEGDIDAAVKIMESEIPKRIKKDRMARAERARPVFERYYEETQKLPADLRAGSATDEDKSRNTPPASDKTAADAAADTTIKDDLHAPVIFPDAAETSAKAVAALAEMRKTERTLEAAKASGRKESWIKQLEGRLSAASLAHHQFDKAARQAAVNERIETAFNAVFAQIKKAGEGKMSPADIVREAGERFIASEWGGELSPENTIRARKALALLHGGSSRHDVLKVLELKRDNPYEPPPGYEDARYFLQRIYVPRFKAAEEEGGGAPAATEATPPAPAAAKKGGVKYPPVPEARNAERVALMNEIDALREREIAIQSKELHAKGKEKTELTKQLDKARAASDVAYDKAKAAGFTLDELRPEPHFSPKNVVWSKGFEVGFSGYYLARRVRINPKTEKDGDSRAEKRYHIVGWEVESVDTENIPDSEKFSPVTFATVEAAQRAGAEWLVNGTLPQGDEGAILEWDKKRAAAFDGFMQPVRDADDKAGGGDGMHGKSWTYLVKQHLDSMAMFSNDIPTALQYLQGMGEKGFSEKFFKVRGSGGIRKAEREKTAAEVYPKLIAWAQAAETAKEQRAEWRRKNPAPGGDMIAWNEVHNASKKAMEEWTETIPADGGGDLSADDSEGDGGGAASPPPVAAAAPVATPAAPPPAAEPTSDRGRVAELGGGEKVIPLQLTSEADIGKVFGEDGLAAAGAKMGGKDNPMRRVVFFDGGRPLAGGKLARGVMFASDGARLFLSAATYPMAWEGRGYFVPTAREKDAKAGWVERGVPDVGSVMQTMATDRVIVSAEGVKELRDQLRAATQAARESIAAKSEKASLPPIAETAEKINALLVLDSGLVVNFNGKYLDETLRFLGQDGGDVLLAFDTANWSSMMTASDGRTALLMPIRGRDSSGSYDVADEKVLRPQFRLQGNYLGAGPPDFRVFGFGERYMALVVARGEHKAISNEREAAEKEKGELEDYMAVARSNRTRAKKKRHGELKRTITRLEKKENLAQGKEKRLEAAAMQEWRGLAYAQEDAADAAAPPATDWETDTEYPDDAPWESLSRTRMGGMDFHAVVQTDPENGEEKKDGNRWILEGNVRFSGKFFREYDRRADAKAAGEAWVNRGVVPAGSHWGEEFDYNEPTKPLSDAPEWVFDRAHREPPTEEENLPPQPAAGDGLTATERANAAAAVFDVRGDEEDTGAAAKKLRPLMAGTDKDSHREFLHGVHFAAGTAMATSGWIMLIAPTAYPSAWKNKMLSRDGMLEHSSQDATFAIRGLENFWPGETFDERRRLSAADIKRILADMDEAGMKIRREYQREHSLAKLPTARRALEDTIARLVFDSSGDEGWTGQFQLHVLEAALKFFDGEDVMLSRNVIRRGDNDEVQSDEDIGKHRGMLLSSASGKTALFMPRDDENPASVFELQIGGKDIGGGEHDFGALSLFEPKAAWAEWLAANQEYKAALAASQRAQRRFKAKDKEHDKADGEYWPMHGNTDEDSPPEQKAELAAIKKRMDALAAELEKLDKEAEAAHDRFRSTNKKMAEIYEKAEAAEKDGGAAGEGAPAAATPAAASPAAESEADDGGVAALRRSYGGKNPTGGKVVWGKQDNNNYMLEGAPRAELNGRAAVYSWDAEGKDTHAVFGFDMSRPGKSEDFLFRHRYDSEAAAVAGAEAFLREGRLPEYDAGQKLPWDGAAKELSGGVWINHQTRQERKEAEYALGGLRLRQENAGVRPLADLSGLAGDADAAAKAQRAMDEKNAWVGREDGYELAAASSPIGGLTFYGGLILSSDGKMMMLSPAKYPPLWEGRSVVGDGKGTRKEPVQWSFRAVEVPDYFMVFPHKTALRWKVSEESLALAREAIETQGRDLRDAAWKEEGKKIAAAL